MPVSSKNFQIDLPAGMTEVKLDSKGCAKVQYTVKNVSGGGKDGRAVLSALPGFSNPKDPVENNWITIDPPAEQHLDDQQDGVIKISIAMKSAPPGEYGFRGGMVDRAKPDVGDWGTGIKVKVLQAAPTPAPKWPILVAIIAVLVIGGGVTAFLLTRGVTVPDLTGKTSADAIQTLTDSKLTLDQNIDQVEDTPEHSGVIVGQDPKPGQKAKSGQAVKVTVGAQMIRMPSLKGHTLAEAQTLITHNGLGSPTVTNAPSSAYSAPGVVFDQTPAEGSGVKSGTPVSLKVTPQQVPVVAVTGMTFGQAYQTLQRASLTPGSTQGDVNQRVVSQSPSSGMVAVGTPVNLVFPCTTINCLWLRPELTQRIYIEKTQPTLTPFRTTLPK
jgi:beta-lactam-binding protein with PASTA domain